MTLLRTTELTVIEIALAVGCQSLGTFTTRFTELVGVPPGRYRDQGAPFREGMLPCIARRLARPVRNREAAGPDVGLS